ncbi:MAG TPA: serine hydrolase [Vitreimonas sp.]|uniref:serine hydrolase n=1 Tax=Vitreimonas sp. TaxID=3069702 RepID=UPI002D4743C7|nr:serine hydrolase [Vitreimonas sp.]HYD86132.1 serine hydrolase [Vitreimonas sp.]
MKASALAALALCVSSAAWADPPANIDARIEEIRTQVGVPGMSVTIVENGEVTLARGYGVRRLGTNERVDADTLFQLGSVGKAFTAAALAVLVDRGEIAWDDPVTDHIPYFQMHDPWVTREMTVRDLLVHRSGLGLGAGDLMFVPRSSRSREDTVRALRHIPPATSFRSGYAYDNVLYAVAGQLIEEVTGKTWERFMREDVLVPAGMRTATSDRVERRRTRNRAWPHGRRDGPMHGMGTQEMLDDSGRAEFDPELGANAAPAGGVAASANDMGRWIRIQLARGALPEGGRLFSEAQSREMWRPQIHVPFGQAPEPVAASTPQFNSYALGWMERDYQGHRLIMHTGAVFGAQSVLMLIPERNVGFAISINSEDGEAALGVAYELLDHYLGRPYYDWGAAWQTFVQQRDQRAVAALQQQASTPAPSQPSLPLARYAGRYQDAWYGPMTITQAADGKLVMDFTLTPGMTGELTHFQYDTFRVAWRDRLIEPAYVTFALNADGQIDRISMRPVSPLADFSFDYQDLNFRPAPAQ